MNKNTKALRNINVELAHKAFSLFSKGKALEASELVLGHGDLWKTDSDLVFLMVLLSANLDRKSDCIAYSRLWLELSFGAKKLENSVSNTLSVNHPEGPYTLAVCKRILAEWNNLTERDFALVRQALGDKKVQSEEVLALHDLGVLELSLGNFQAALEHIMDYKQELERRIKEAFASSPEGDEETMPDYDSMREDALVVLNLTLVALGRYKEASELFHKDILPSVPKAFLHEDQDFGLLFEIEGGENTYLPGDGTGMGMEMDMPELVVGYNNENRGPGPIRRSPNPKEFPSLLALPDGSWRLASSVFTLK